jgi:hypothetical protein
MSLTRINATAAIEVPRSNMKASRQDPAELSGYLRFFYRDWRPTRLGRIWSAVFAWATGLGLSPQILLTLQVRDRNSGRLSSTVLVGASHQGKRYVVSMLGDGSEWVQNTRAAGGMAFIKRGRSRPVRLTEIPPRERAPILKAWSQVATSGRRHLPVAHDAPVTAFEAMRRTTPSFRLIRRDSLCGKLALAKSKTEQQQRQHGDGDDGNTGSTLQNARATFELR